MRDDNSPPEMTRLDSGSSIHNAAGTSSTSGATFFSRLEPNSSTLGGRELGRDGETSRELVLSTGTLRLRLESVGSVEEEAFCLRDAFDTDRFLPQPKTDPTNAEAVELSETEEGEGVRTPFASAEVRARKVAFKFRTMLAMDESASTPSGKTILNAAANPLYARSALREGVSGGRLGIKMQSRLTEFVDGFDEFEVGLGEDVHESCANSRKRSPGA